MPGKPWDLPEAEPLRRYVDRVLAERRDRVEFVVLFGCTARGDWGLGSVAEDDRRRWVDRQAEWKAEGNVEVFCYGRSEWERMFAQRDLLLLDALEHGAVIRDRGSFWEMRFVFCRWRERGEVVP